MASSVAGPSGSSLSAVLKRAWWLLRWGTSMLTLLLSRPELK
jgi:hypothetical protein